MQSTLKIVSIFICLILALTPMAFASDPEPEQAPLEVEKVPDPYLTLETKAQEYRAAAKTLDDVYNILNSGLMSGTTPKLDNIYSNISSNLEFWAGNTRYSIADLQGMTWGLAQDIESDIAIMISQGTNLITETQRTNAKLEYVFSAIEDTINIKWYAADHAYNGTSLGLDSNYLTSNSSNSVLYVSYNFLSYVTPQLYRVTMPIRFINPYAGDVKLDSIYVTTDFNSYTQIPTPEYFIEHTTSGTYLYLFNWQPYSGNSYHYYFKFYGSRNIQFRPTYDTGVVAIPFDTLDYHIIRTAFNSASSADSDKQSLDKLVQISAQLSALAQSSQSGSDAAEALADYFVSPAKQAAEDASSQVINSTLNNFTGSGSGAAKSSDSNAMKDVSGSIQSGLNGGGSVSGATGVFNSGSDFWGWFTQQNSNYINYPYPAPIVNSTRGSGDEIVDFLTPNSNELQDLLRQGGDQR